MIPRSRPRSHATPKKTGVAVAGLSSILKKWKREILIGAGVAAVGIGGIAYLATRPPPPPPKLIPADATPEQVRELASSIPEEQRPRLRQEMRERGEARRNQREAEENKRAAEYAALRTQAERDAFLDKRIDEMQARWKEMQARRQANGNRGPGGGPGGPPPGGQAGGPPPGGGQGGPPGGGPGGRGPRTPEQRDSAMRNRLDSSSPAERAQRQQLMEAMRKRMAARGIQAPGRPGGGGGGPR